MRVRALSVVVLAALCSVALAQGRGQAHTKPDKKTYKATTIDTRLFFPQVVHTVTANVIDPENPVQPPDFVSGPGNGLPFGGLLNEPRTNPGFAFPGITATGWHPADPDIAVGPNNIVEVVNMSIAFYAKDGTLQLEQTAQNMFSGTGAGSFDFDPKCFYDRIHDRFVILYLERSTGADPDVSKVLVAVSDDGDPNGVWFTYRFEAMLTFSGVDYWMDYPGFGYNKDAYAANGNMFSFPSNSFIGAQFLVMPSAPMLTGSPVTVTNIFDPSARNVQMAEVIDPVQPNIFAASRLISGTAARIYAISNLTTTPVIASVDVTVPSNAAPSTDAT
ncbi:MAG TPA: hypothetical protein VNI20_10670, partial [Fimbriimonadaceae bacterium]|nr:hypothetical protein [Fimbriimonadaceae bacterium]